MSDEPSSAPRARTRVPSAASGNKPVVPADIQAAKKEIDKLHGEGMIKSGREMPRVNYIPTGCFILDFALLGGLTQGYPTMVYGFHSTGKTRLLLGAAARYQQKHPDKWVGLIDSEGMFDSLWAEQLGVDLDRLVYAQPDYGEQCVDVMDDFMSRPSMGTVILDSIPACVPMDIVDKSAEDDTMAELARLMGKLNSKVIHNQNRERRKGHWVSTWWVNQFRNKVGFVMGSPLHLPGGVQINHLPTTKLWLKLGKEISTKDADGMEIPDFNEQTFKFEKTKFGSCLKEGAFQLNLNPNRHDLPLGAYDNAKTLVAFGKRMGFVTGGGSSWRCLADPSPDRRFNSLAALQDELRADPVLEATLARSLIVHQRKKHKLSPLPPDGYLWSSLGGYVEIDLRESADPGDFEEDEDDES